MGLGEQWRVAATYRYSAQESFIHGNNTRSRSVERCCGHNLSPRYRVPAEVCAGELNPEVASLCCPTGWDGGILVCRCVHAGPLRNYPQLIKGSK